jgi:hypothetical protein
VFGAVCKTSCGLVGFFGSLILLFFSCGETTTEEKYLFLGAYDAL